MDETPEAARCRYNELRLLPWRCARAGLLSVPFVIGVWLLLDHWGTRFPPIEWTLPVCIPTLYGLAYAISLTPQRLVFSQDDLQQFYHPGFWIKGSRANWRSVRRWTLQRSRWKPDYAVLALYLTWGRRLNVSIHISQQERVASLLQDFCPIASCSDHGPGGITPSHFGKQND